MVHVAHTLPLSAVAQLDSKCCEIRPGGILSDREWMLRNGLSATKLTAGNILVMLNVSSLAELTTIILSLTNPFSKVGSELLLQIF